MPTSGLSPSDAATAPGVTVQRSYDLSLFLGDGFDADDARVLYNFAHHIAHAWVPKRAYGHGYFPFQWELAPVLDSIWFAEGFGQYAAIQAVAAGSPDPAAYPTTPRR